MKKILLLAVMAVVSTTYVFGQDKFTEYQASYFDNESFGIEVGELDKKDNFRVFVEIKCSEKIGEPLFIFMNSDKLEEFKNAIAQIRDKYAEWRQIAINNKVANAKKDFDIKIPSCGGVFRYGRDWRFDYSVALSARFLVLEESDNYLMIVDTNELVASDNKFMKTQGYIVFSSVEEVDAFLNVLDESKMRAFVESKTSDGDLFQ